MVSEEFLGFVENATVEKKKESSLTSRDHNKTYSSDKGTYIYSVHLNAVRHKHTLHSFTQ